jgi:hypothetical protein
LGIIFAVAGVLVASYYSKRELDKIIAQDENQNEGEKEGEIEQVAPENTVV